MKEIFYKKSSYVGILKKTIAFYFTWYINIVILPSLKTYRYNFYPEPYRISPCRSMRSMTLFFMRSLLHLVPDAEINALEFLDLLHKS